MRVSSVARTVNFKRALSTIEEKDFTATAKMAKKALGIEDGTTIFKFYVPSMPKNLDTDTGSGKLCSKETAEFLRTMNVYTDADADKMMPDGILDKMIKNIYIPYLRGCLTLGEDGINLEEMIINPEYGGILPEYEFKELVEKNRRNHKSNWINYENEMGFDRNYPILKPLKSAYNNLMSQKNDAQIALKQEFDKYKLKPINEYHERIAVAHLIQEGKLPKDFFVGFESDEHKKARFEQIKKEYATDIDFFKFCQFLAQKQHNKQRKELNEQGTELWGDCQIAFGNFETLAYPDAFVQNATVGWGLPVLKFDEIFDENSASHNIFKQKLTFFLENYDGIRFDVGWSYINPVVKHKDGSNNTERYSLEDKLLNFIDKTAKEVKGSDFDTTRNLMYEADAGIDDFSYIDLKTGKYKDFLKGHTLVLTTQYQNTGGWDGKGWNNPEFFEKIGVSPSDYTLGHNHDVLSYRALSQDNTFLKSDNVTTLSKLLKIDRKFIEIPDNFVKAKFAELFLCKNRYFMYYDVLGKKDALDSHGVTPDEYRLRLDMEWEKKFHEALQNNKGFNLMEALQMAMKAKGLDKTASEIYSKVCKYSDILREKGCLTRNEADKAEKKSAINGIV